MRRLSFLALVVVTLTLLTTSGLVAAKPPDHAAPPDHAGQPGRRSFAVQLSGDQEVPAVATAARGVAVFHLSKDGTTLRWKIVANHIADVTQAHIHGPADAATNADPLVTLFDRLYAGEQRGLLARGTITRGADLDAATFDRAVAAMRDGLAYVNVHTTANQGGEIRGQVGRHGHDDADTADEAEDDEDDEDDAAGHAGKPPGHGHGHGRKQK